MTIDTTAKCWTFHVNDGRSAACTRDATARLGAHAHTKGRMAVVFCADTVVDATFGGATKPWRAWAVVRRSLTCFRIRESRHASFVPC